MPVSAGVVVFVGVVLFLIVGGVAGFRAISRGAL